MGRFKTKTEVFKNDEWIEIQFIDLEVGDKFRLVESNGSLVEDTEMIVTKAPYCTGKGGNLELEAEYAEGCEKNETK